MTEMDTVKFHVGEIVYHLSAPERPGVVTGVIFRQDHADYFVTFSPESPEVILAACELTREKSFSSGDNTGAVS